MSDQERETPVEGRARFEPDPFKPRPRFREPTPIDHLARQARENKHLAGELEAVVRRLSEKPPRS